MNSSEYNLKILDLLTNENPTFKPQIAQIADEDSYLETIPNKKFTATLVGVSTNVVLRRYKIRICSMHDSTIPVEQLPWAYAQITSSGLARESTGTAYYPKNTYVTVVQNESTGDYYIDKVHPNSVVNPGNNFENACKPGSGIIPGSVHFQIPDTACKPSGKGTASGSETHSTVPCLKDEKQNYLALDENTQSLGIGCKKIDTDKINQGLKKALKNIQEAKKNLLGKDSFLSTTQDFLNKRQEEINKISSDISNMISWLIQELRRYINQQVNEAIGNVSGNVPLSQRYLLNEISKGTLNTVSCIFVRILENLENIIRQILDAIIDKIVNTAQCILENLLGEIIGQILGQVIPAVNQALGAVSNFVGSVVTLADEVFTFLESILDFLECKITNVCPVPIKWNILNGAPPPFASLDVNRVIGAAKGAYQSGANLASIPQNLSNFNFTYDANAAFLGALGCLGFGPAACGPPNVVFWGGSGSGGIGNAVINAFGDIIGVDIISPGIYTEAPVIAFEDSCGNGVGAYGIPVLGDVEVPVTEPPTTGIIGITGTTGTTGTTETTGTTGTATTTVTGIVGVIMEKTGYGYLPSPDGSKGGMERTWADRCQTIVRRANGTWDPPYSYEQPIKLFFGDMIQLPGREEVYIDCNFNASKLPGCNVVGTLTCLKSMIGFDDSRGTPFNTLNVKSMVGFDDLRGSSLENTPPIPPEHKRRVDELMSTTEAIEAFERERILVEQGAIQGVYRPDQFGFINDYPYAKELGFSDQDIRFYLEGFYSKTIGKRIGPLMQVVLNDPNFGPLPKYLSGNGGAGEFDYENDYPYAVSLGFTDQDIRYYLEKFYTGIISDSMKKKLNDPSWGRIPEFYVTITAPDCPPQNPPTNNYNVITSVGDVYIESGGFGYSPNDTAVLLDCAGNPDAATKLSIDVDQDGTITKVRVLQTGTNYNCIPEIRINTQTGNNARLKPILKFTRAKDDEVPPGTIPLKVIDCVGKV